MTDTPKEAMLRSCGNVTETGKAAQIKHEQVCNVSVLKRQEEKE